MTGAPIPGGADAVQMIEKTEELEVGAGAARRRVRVLAPCRPGENIARRGEDLRCGDTILPAGSLIRAAEVGALAAAGRTSLAVHRLPVVSLLSTGDELVEPGEKPLPHQIRNSNGPALLAALAGFGLAPVSLGIARDDADDLDAKLAGGLAGDLLLVIGGVSVGDKDLVSERLLAAGVEPLFHRIAMKPGKPLFFGRRGTCLVFGLPGNPLSALTAFLVFALPAIRKLMGLRAEGLPALRARLEGRLSQKTGRTWYRLARATAVDGALVAAPVRSSGSGDLASAARANAFIVVPAETPAVEEGESVSVLLWPGFELH
jgi:molybdopterin molybdotransferase